MSLNKHLYLALMVLVSVTGCGGGGGTSSGDVGTTTSPDTTASYTITISTTGLGSNKVSLLLLSPDNSQQLNITVNGTTAFLHTFVDGTSYSISVSAQPEGQTCTLGDNKSGTISGGDVTVSLSCVDNYDGPQVQVDVRDALESGESITLNLNGTESKEFTLWLFSYDKFASPLVDGDVYSVSVETHPTGKLCNLYDASGVTSGGVSPLVTVQCGTDTGTTYNVSGAVTGLTGSGLKLSLNGSESVNIDPGSANYAFATELYDGAFYNAEIVSHPDGQICSLKNASGSISGAAESAVDVICSTGPHTIGGTATGVDGIGLTLMLNGVEDLSVPSSGGFVFPTVLSDGMDYVVTVKTHPVGQECTVFSGEGRDITSSISDILVECVEKSYQVGVNLSGFSGGGSPLWLVLNGSERVYLDYDTWRAKMFDSLFADGAAYEVAILAQPSGLHCTLTNATGTISGADVTNVSASCVAEPAGEAPYSVSFTTTGLLGSGLQVSLNDGDPVAISTNGYSSFPTTLDDGLAYQVSVVSQPGQPLQQCKVQSSSGTISGQNVTNVAVICGNAVEPLYPSNGPRWQDYVKNPEVITGALPDVACEAGVDSYFGQGACLDGGEYRVIEAGYLASCDGVTAEDNLSAFNWVCDVSSGSVRIQSTGLKAWVALTDLIDFDAVAFKDNFVTITSPGGTASTQPTKWWRNKIRVSNSGVDSFSYYPYDNDIILVTDNVPAFYTVRSNTALLVQPGYSVSGYTRSKYIVSTNLDVDTNFTRVEGRFDDVTRGTAGGIRISGDFKKLMNVQVANTGGDGISMDKGNSELVNVVSSNNSGQGLTIGGRNLYVDGVTATGNLGTAEAIEITNYDHITLKNINVSDNLNASAGLLMPPNCELLMMENVTANNNGGDGVKIGGWDGSVLIRSYNIANLTANDNGGNGLYVGDTAQSDFFNISAHRNGLDGVYMDTAENSKINEVDASGNGSDGVVIYRWDDSAVKNIRTADNVGYGIMFEQSHRLIVSNIISANNAISGISADTVDGSIWNNLTTANNAVNGMTNSSNSSERDPNVFLGITSVNNGAYGLSSGGLSAYQYQGVLLAHNNSHGLYTSGFTEAQLFYNIASANNGGAGISLDSDRDYFTGLLMLGTNVENNCIVDSSFSAEPGLLATDGKGGTPVGDCVNNLNSDATIIQDADLTTSLIAAVSSDDVTNQDDYLGSAAYEAITDWYAFDNSYRTWGADAVAGRCSSGTNCRIWDWSVASTDIGNSGSAALLNVMTLPATGDETFRIDWTLTTDSQAVCDDLYPGSVLDADGAGCVSTYLRNAVEIEGDSLGNDNFLCESSETCLYTPNIGSYQGHGSLVSAGMIGTGGTLSNITLMRYEQNGR